MGRGQKGDVAERAPGAASTQGAEHEDGAREEADSQQTVERHPRVVPSPADSLLEQALCLCHRLGARLADLQGGACCTNKSLGALRFMDALTELLWHAHVGVPNSATTASRLLSPQPRLPAPHP